MFQRCRITAAAYLTGVMVLSAIPQAAAVNVTTVSPGQAIPGCSSLISQLPAACQGCGAIIVLGIKTGAVTK
jgi:hypothetical protein